MAHSYLALAEPRYDFVVIDEVQDLTNVEIAQALKTLKAPGQLVLARPRARRRAVHLRPRLNYRNIAVVTRTANALLEIKQACFGAVDKESNRLIRPVASREGEIVGLPSDAKAIAELDEKTRRSTRFAVIVLRDGHKAEAKKRSRTPLVFSVHEAKGLEYENVVLFEIVSRERARAVECVYVVETDVGHPLLARLGVSFAQGAPVIDGASSSIDEWQREARKLEQQGKREQADDAELAAGPFAALFEVLAPPSVDVQVDDRLFKIGRERGEYFFLVATGRSSDSRRT